MKTLFIILILLSNFALADSGRHWFAKKLMRHSKVSEATLYPWIRHRNQPYRIYQRFEKKFYTEECRKYFDSVQGRYFRMRYKSDDKFNVEGVVALPKNFDVGRKYPAVIWNHGNFEEGRRFTPCFIPGYEQWTKAGYVVFGPQYKGIHGGEGNDEYGGSDIFDVTSIVSIAKSYPFVDDRNVYMAGASRGGMMTYLALKKGVSVNAVAVLCGLVDLFTLTDNPVKIAFPKSTAIELARKNRARSATYWPEKLNRPILILHGEEDASLPVDGVRSFAKKLRKLGLASELHVYPNTTHCLAGAPKEYFQTVLAWFKRYRR